MHVFVSARLHTPNSELDKSKMMQKEPIFLHGSPNPGVDHK